MRQVFQEQTLVTSTRVSLPLPPSATSLVKVAATMGEVETAVREELSQIKTMLTSN